MFKRGSLPNDVGRVVEAGVLSYFELLHSGCDLKVTQTNIQLSLICNLSFMVPYWTVILRRHPKLFVAGKMKSKLMTVH